MYLLYFDPGLGAMIVQVIVATVAGVVLFSKNLVFKIKVLLGLDRNDDNSLFEDIDVTDSDVKNTKKPDSE